MPSRGSETPSDHHWPKEINAASRCSGGRGWSSKGCLTWETVFEWGLGPWVGGQQAEKKGKDSLGRGKSMSKDRVGSGVVECRGTCDPGEAEVWGTCGEQDVTRALAARRS